MAFPVAYENSFTEALYTHPIVTSLAHYLTVLTDHTGLYPYELRSESGKFKPFDHALFWRRPPQYHVVEFIVFHLFVLVLLMYSRGFYTRFVYGGSNSSRHGGSSFISNFRFLHHGTITNLFVSNNSISSITTPSSNGKKNGKHATADLLDKEEETQYDVEYVRSPLDVLLGVVYVVCWLCQLLFKCLRQPWFIQISWMVMPCHLITLSWSYVLLTMKVPKIITVAPPVARQEQQQQPKAAAATVPKTATTPQQQHELQHQHFRKCVWLATLCCVYHWGPVPAVVWPDWEDHILKIEGTVFWIHHGLLLIQPLYWAFLRRYPLLPFSSTFLAHLTWIAAFINVGPYTIICYISGLNINYHLFPPTKLLKMPLFMSVYYRYYVIVLLIVCSSLFWGLWRGSSKIAARLRQSVTSAAASSAPVLLDVTFEERVSKHKPE